VQEIDPVLLDLYNGNKTKIEIFPGGLLEALVPDGLVGPTFHCLIKEQFQRLKDGDRFFFTHKKKRTWCPDDPRFTKFEQELIMGRKLRDVICDNSQNTEMQAKVLKKINPFDNPLQKCKDGTRLDSVEIKSLIM